MAAEELTVPALGRPSFLGQLYNASTGRLLNDSLFPADAVTDASEYKNHVTGFSDVFEVKSSESRANTLAINASISVTLMGGLMKLTGQGSYLDRSDSQQEAVSVSAVVRTTTVHCRLISDRGLGLKAAVIISEDNLRKIGATHVVTAITYGGALIGSVTETNSRLNDSTTTRGEFNLKTAEGFGFLQGASGNAKLSADVKESIGKYNLELRLLGDYLIPGAGVPVTVEEFNMRVKDGSSLLKVGIPVELILTPCKMYKAFSTELMYTEVQGTQLGQIRGFLDKVVDFNQSRLYLFDQIDRDGQEFYPSLRKSCQEGYERADLFTLEARTELGQLIKSSRSGAISNSSGAMAQYLLENSNRLSKEKHDYDTDYATWRAFLNSRTAAKQGQFPFITPQELSKVMDSTSADSIALVVLPYASLHVQVLNLYQGLYNSVTNLHKALNLANKLSCYTVFADEAADDALLLLDGDNGALQFALDSARKTSSATFVTYRMSRNAIALDDWRGSKQEAWGMIEDLDENTRYIGELKNGVPHGLGVMTLADASTYSGTWFYGKRDGEGEERDANDVLRRKGIYVDGIVQDKGQLIPVVMYEDGVPVASATVAVVCIPVPESDDRQEIAAFEATVAVHVKKIAKAFGWIPGQRHRLTTTWFFRQFHHPNGNFHDPRPSPIALPYCPTVWSGFFVVTNGPMVEKINYDQRDFVQSCWLVGAGGLCGIDGEWIPVEVEKFAGRQVEAIVLHDEAGV